MYSGLSNGIERFLPAYRADPSTVCDTRDTIPKIVNPPRMLCTKVRLEFRTTLKLIVVDPIQITQRAATPLVVEGVVLRYATV